MNEYQSMAVNAICHTAKMAGEKWRHSTVEYSRLCVVFKPKLFIDGGKGCELYCANLQDGVSAFGDTPAWAMWNFDDARNAKLKPSNIALAYLSHCHA